MMRRFGLVLLLVLGLGFGGCSAPHSDGYGPTVGPAGEAPPPPARLGRRAWYSVDSVPPPPPSASEAPASRGSGASRSPASGTAIRRHRVEPVTPAPAAERPGLGTTFGERLSSSVHYVQFERAQVAPDGAVAIHYNDHQGVLAMARLLRRTCCTRMTAGAVGAGVTVQLTDAYRQPLSGLQLDGRTLVLGRAGDRYGLLVYNGSARRVEVLASVDGLDVVDGRRAALAKRGYIVPAYGTLFIEGYRTSQHTVAAFRFGSVRDSYAARTGDDRHVGVVGVAVWSERRPPEDDAEARRRLQAQPFDDRYAQPPP